MAEFKTYGKTPRLRREVVVTEKIDGTNGGIHIETVEGADGNNADKAIMVSVGECDYLVTAQSRNRIITPGKTTDNYGFAAWVHENAETLVADLGVGLHFGEWWGKGIARGYGMDRKVFSLFRPRNCDDAYITPDLREVPWLDEGVLSDRLIENALSRLAFAGSLASDFDFQNPEGICIFHTQSRQVYKVLLENDELPKGLLSA